MMHEAMRYKRVDGRDLIADVYRAADRTPSGAPAIACFHGGGWVHGDRTEFSHFCERYARKGFVAVTFQYRLSARPGSTHPDPDVTPVECVKDARSGLRWIRANAQTLGVDPDRIVVAGQSAGGQLALCTALADGVDEPGDDLAISPVPAAIVLYASCVNTVIPWVDWHLGDRREEIWSISPYHLARPGMPPVIHFHGDADCVVLPYQVRHFADRMAELGNGYDLQWYEGRGHLLAPQLDTYARYFDDEVLQRTDLFLAAHGLAGVKQRGLSSNTG